MNQPSFDFSSPKMTEQEFIIWDFIRLNRGKEYAITGHFMEQRLYISYKTIQKTIMDLVNIHHKLIGSCDRGYYIPTTPEEVREATRPLRSRAMKILWRCSNLQKTSIEEVYGQARMEFEK